MDKVRITHTPSGQVYDLWPIGTHLVSDRLLCTVAIIVSYEWDGDGNFGSLAPPQGNTITWQYRVSRIDGKGSAIGDTFVITDVVADSARQF